jgi:hypothetical protein
MQDAFVRALERWDRIDNPAAYLYRCTERNAQSVPSAPIGRQRFLSSDQ